MAALAVRQNRLLDSLYLLRLRRAAPRPVQHLNRQSRQTLVYRRAQPDRRRPDRRPDLGQPQRGTLPRRAMVGLGHHPVCRHLHDCADSFLELQRNQHPPQSTVYGYGIGRTDSAADYLAVWPDSLPDCSASAAGRSSSPSFCGHCNCKVSATTPTPSTWPSARLLPLCCSPPFQASPRNTKNNPSTGKPSCA